MRIYNKFKPKITIEKYNYTKKGFFISLLIFNGLTKKDNAALI